MRTYNQTSQNIMPLMMNFTTQTPIVNEQQMPLIYNDMNHRCRYENRWNSLLTFKYYTQEK